MSGIEDFFGSLFSGVSDGISEFGSFLDEIFSGKGFKSFRSPSVTASQAAKYGGPAGKGFLQGTIEDGKRIFNDTSSAGVPDISGPPAISTKPKRAPTGGPNNGSPVPTVSPGC